MSDKEAMSLLPDNKEVIEIVTRTIIEIPADNPSNPVSYTHLFHLIRCC